MLCNEAYVYVMFSITSNACAQPGATHKNVDSRLQDVHHDRFQKARETLKAQSRFTQHSATRLSLETHNNHPPVSVGIENLQTADSNQWVRIRRLWLLAARQPADEVPEVHLTDKMSMGCC